MTRVLVVLIAGALAGETVSAQGQPKLRVRAVAYSPDGSHLAAATGEPKGAGLVVVWDAKGKEVHRLELEAGVPSIAFAPDGLKLALASYDGQARVLEVASGKITQSLQLPKAVFAVAFGPDGRLATAGAENAVRIWDVAAGKELAKSGETKLPVTLLDFSPDGKRIVGSDRRQAFVWDASTLKLERTLGEPFGSTTGVAFAEGGRFIVHVVGNDGSIVVQDSGTGQFRLRTSTHGGTSYAGFAAGVAVTSYSFELSRLTVIRLRLNEPLLAEQTRIEELLKQLDADELAVRENAGRELEKFGTLVEPFLKRAMADSPSAEVRLRSRKLRERVLGAKAGTVTLPEGGVSGLAVAPDGKQVAVAGTDGAVRLVDVASGLITGRRTMQR